MVHLKCTFSSKGMSLKDRIGFLFHKYELATHTVGDMLVMRAASTACIPSHACLPLKACIVHNWRELVAHCTDTKAGSTRG
jgi:hypothetical protein